jgi:hypothetical protein
MIPAEILLKVCSNRQCIRFEEPDTTKNYSHRVYPRKARRIHFHLWNGNAERKTDRGIVVIRSTENSCYVRNFGGAVFPVWGPDTGIGVCLLTFGRNTLSVLIRQVDYEFLNCLRTSFIVFFSLQIRFPISMITLQTKFPTVAINSMIAFFPCFKAQAKTVQKPMISKKILSSSKMHSPILKNPFLWPPFHPVHFVAPFALVLKRIGLCYLLMNSILFPLTDSILYFLDQPAWEKF